MASARRTQTSQFGVKIAFPRWRYEKLPLRHLAEQCLKLAGFGPMLGRYKRANAGPIQSGQSWADTGNCIDFYRGVSSVLAKYRLYCCRYKRYSPV